MMPIRPENKKKYAKNWKAVSWFIRIVRAEERCEFCGALNGRPHPVTGAKVVLTCAHLDHNEGNDFWFNGLFVSPVALCQRCHNGYDANHRRKTRRKNEGDFC